MDVGLRSPAGTLPAQDDFDLPGDAAMGAPEGVLPDANVFDQVILPGIPDVSTLLPPASLLPDAGDFNLFPSPSDSWLQPPVAIIPVPAPFDPQPGLDNMEIDTPESGLPDANDFALLSGCDNTRGGPEDVLPDPADFNLGSILTAMTGSPALLDAGPLFPVDLGSVQVDSPTSE